ncbi:hypothetical protein HHI36_011703 [Cryptolaemus montrouzieri]|uniref:ZAD domain-containing protein n=1 Tax=Cryptolaemus montrouzieri TaxID=559131 RepID=A0ABD2MMH1_9CUCU
MALTFHYSQTDKICRACLKEGSEYISMQSDLREIFSTCTGIMVDANEKIPSNLCLECHSEMLRNYNFRELCRKSDIVIRENLKYKLDDFDLNIEEIVDECLSENNVIIEIDNNHSNITNTTNITETIQNNTAEFLNNETYNQILVNNSPRLHLTELKIYHWKIIFQ